MSRFAQPRPAKSRRSLAVIALVLAGGLVAACAGSNASSEENSSSFGTASADTPTLTFGVQTADYPALFEKSGLFEDLPYKLDVPVISGPAAQISALHSKAIDVGLTGAGTAAVEAANQKDDPNVTGQAAIEAIAIYNQIDSPYPSPSLFVQKSAGIDTLADLRGKKIAYNVGGNIYAAYVIALFQAGLTPADVQPVALADNQAAAAAFVAGEVDAVLTTYGSVQRLLSTGDAVALPTNPELYTIVGGGSHITRPDVLDDPAKVDALRDFFGRYDTFWTEWYPAHKDEVIEVYRNELKQTEEIANINFDASATTRLLKLGDPELIAKQQLTVDQAFKAGGVKNQRDIAIAYNPIFDPQFTQ
ncbi:PhnD/SsuA/transferrin family substrate-binding protein [Rhodococcoides yunnanense]|uniref:PhnD/SsuA/transferrin family substrate-binding protein n=1 Tax=Rhodococcoides yunnanense TaxID=278209 RepID=UPI0009331C41|nr:PhnD/SsuA/transferrin family substrate-binding protein [Rhodococcus yunnanensis]